MPRGGSRSRLCGSGRKRRKTWDTECTLFPGESMSGLRKEDPGTPAANTSLSKAWLKCGDGFQTDTVPPTIDLSTEMAFMKKHLESSFRSKQASPFEASKGPPDIIWSSSGSDLSEEDKEMPCQSQKHKRRTPHIERKHTRNNLGLDDSSSESEPRFIDWENDSDSKEDVGNECPEFGEDENAVEISDCISCASSSPQTSEERELDFSQMSSTEILEYSSDVEKQEDIKNMLPTNLEFDQKYHINFGLDLEEDKGRPASDWIKSAQVLLHTPKKETDKTPRTPEDSAKKKNKKLLRGGLAERLTRLQNRERSAITFWRHQSASSNKALPGKKSGVLIVKIIEMHEECTMQIAICELLERSPADSSSTDAVLDPGTQLKVLFTKETAVHLKGRPQDVIHIYPPWHKLLLHDKSVPIIMNTYFCQKVVVKEDSEKPDKMHCLGILPTRRKIISLAQMFKFKSQINDIAQESEGHQEMCTNVTATRTGRLHDLQDIKPNIPAQLSISDSLLDVIECQGTARWKGVRVQVVVQRVYYLPVRNVSRYQQGNNSIQLAAPLGNADLHSVRCCLLVQDAYGIFSEVHLESLCSPPEDITQRNKQWEGKFCSLGGMKILQRTTRGRAMGLFSLIDSLWPPLVPLKIPGKSQDCEEMKADQKPPSFCYILTACPEPGEVGINVENTISNLYRPPAIHSLKDLLKEGGLGGHRCSFHARVIYQRLQLKSNLPLDQREIWLIVTDATLQLENAGLPKTVPVCVTSSCVINLEVIEALTDAASHTIFFKDVLQENGRLICVERTVLMLQKPFLYGTGSADTSELTSPVILDELDSTTPVNSICSVQGMVVGVNENTAFSWPICNRCGNEKLEQDPENRGSFHCGRCTLTIPSPLLKMHLEVVLACPSRPQGNVKVKLLQRSISSLLMFPSSEDGTYEVKSVLGKKVGPLNCFIQTITNHPISCIGLEEIELLQAGRN
ncbi:DNA repair-scaffolding protein isoform X2 [Dromiciops gliroides]|uniref:DNA repair-scaffolding protein isoform X2 n=1 Tax=Dromiciops gliroides TaxID=33562 RepID=UPI001CC74F20|nr:DNA repair-scaffolding protein isoform X2 [Dromiciops gliroides]